MNSESVPAGTQVYLVNYSFNQDASCFCLATSEGFRVLTVDPLSEFSRRIVGEQSGEVVTIACMLYQTNYLALVLKSAPYKVLLWDDSRKQPPHEIWSRFEILNVLLRREVVVVVSEYKIYIYEFGSFSVLLHIETCGNSRGISAISAGGESSGINWVLACPGKIKGTIRLQRGTDDTMALEISAHNHPVVALALNSNGSLLASASEQGTVIKVFSVERQTLLHVLRRGTTATTITSLSFREDSKFLAVGSAAATVHVFKLEEGSNRDDFVEDEIPEEYKLSLKDAVRSAVGGLVGGMVENVVGMPKYFQAIRSYAQLKFPDFETDQPGVDLRFISSQLKGPVVAFGKGSRIDRIYAIHYNGILYQGIYDSVKESNFQTGTVVFASRADFALQSVPHEDEENWQVL